MANDEPTRAVIVGAGIGGLAAALALERAGFEVVVLEQAETVRELGFALLLAANAMRALRLLGVADRVLAGSEVAAVGELRAHDGRVLKRVSLASIQRSTGEAAACALRTVVHGALLEALQRTEIRTSARVVGFEHEGSTAVVRLSDGTRVEAPVLIGADGIHSTVRRAIAGDALRRSGLCAWRGVVHGGFDGGAGAQIFGRGTEAGIARAGGGAVYWYVSTKLGDARTHARAGTVPKDAVLEATLGMDAELRALIERTEPANLRYDELFDRKPLTHWRQQRATLLGDAAHPMLPHAGQGAAQALEDAVVLGRCLASDRDIEAALDRYERLRIPRTTHVVATARRNASVATTGSGVLCKLRDLLLQYGPATLMEKQLVALANVQLEV